MSISCVCCRSSAPVPPGFGKPQTRQRNERRRKKRLAKREGSTTPPAPVGSANAIPLGTAKPVPTPEPMMMMSLRNKNKRRKFKDNAGVPSRITFQDSVAGPSPPPRLVPPSERDQLPPGLFVTSVDVEADMWPTDGVRARDQKGKKARRDANECKGEQDDVALDYGKALEEDSAAVGSSLDYLTLEKAWTRAPRLVNKTVLPIGCVVGWQVRQSSTSFDKIPSKIVGTWDKPHYAHTRNDAISCACSDRRGR